MIHERRVSRRSLLKVGIGGAAAAALAPFGAVTAFAAPQAGNGNGRLIPAGKVGTITFTQRDVPARLGIAASATLGQAPVMGYLGGDDPMDLDDLGPLVPLPGGWRELLEFLANAGYNQVEFAGYSQNASNPGGFPRAQDYVGGVANPDYQAAYRAYARTLRGFLDELGLEAIGNHGFIPNTWPGPNSAGGGMSQADYDRFQLELEVASILGMPYMGTGSDPTSANNRNIEPWTVAAEKWHALSELSLQWGIQLYPHNHSPAYNFLQDGPMVTVTQDRMTGAPMAPTQVRGESGKRLMEYFLEVTDPSLQVIELDIFWAHVAQHQHRWYYDYDGNRVEKIFDPLTLVASQPNRFALYHAKDGDKVPGAPPSQNGYNMVPFGHPTSDIDFATFFKEQGAKGYHNPNYEQDTAPGSNLTPEGRGQSLRLSKFSAANLNSLRG